MRSINRFSILGHVGKITPFAKATKIDIATNRRFKKDGAITTATDWVTVTVLNERQAAWLSEHLTVGEKVYVEGRISNSRYDRDGTTVYTTDLIASLVNALGDHDDAEAVEHGTDD